MVNTQWPAVTAGTCTWCHVFTSRSQRRGQCIAQVNVRTWCTCAICVVATHAYVVLCCALLRCALLAAGQRSGTSSTLVSCTDGAASQTVLSTCARSTVVPLPWSTIKCTHAYHHTPTAVICRLSIRASLYLHLTSLKHTLPPLACEHPQKIKQ